MIRVIYDSRFCFLEEDDTSSNVLTWHQRWGVDTPKFAWRLGHVRWKSLQGGDRCLMEISPKGSYFPLDCEKTSTMLEAAHRSAMVALQVQLLVMNDQGCSTLMSFCLYGMGLDQKYPNFLSTLMSCIIYSRKAAQRWSFLKAPWTTQRQGKKWLS